MNKKLLLSALLLITVISICFAAEISGHWTGKINDQFDVAYDFKADGTKLTGTTKGPDGAVIEIKDGVVKGDSISFSIAIMDSNVPIKGVVNGDVMNLSMSFNGNAMGFVLKRDGK